jgi:diguanylate cyclase (GGDEF)-like protein/PAS domain S-box-containing protein
MKKLKRTNKPGAGRPAALSQLGSKKSAATQSNYRSLIDSAALSFIETDLDGTIVDCNPALAQMLSGRLEEFKGCKLLKLVPEKWHETEAKTGREVVENGVTEEYEIELCKKDRAVFPVMIKKWLHTDKHGKARSIWMLVQDITDGKKSHDTVYQRAALLLESQNRYRSLLAGAPIGILTVDKFNRIESVNPAVQELLGYGGQGIVGRMLDDFITTLDGRPLLVLSRRAQNALARCHNGNTLPVQITCSELRAGGQLLYTCFLQDLSLDAENRDALRRAHDELELRVREGTAEIARLSDALQSEISERTWAQEQFQVAVESAPNGILIVDPIANIRLVNAKIEQLFHYHRGELIGRSIEMLLPERFHAQNAGLREMFFADPSLSMCGSSTEIFGLRRDGVEFPMEISLNPIHTPQGKSLLISLVDATERKRVESELKRTAFHDALTGLPNRTLFLDNLLRLNAMAKRHGHHPFALLFLDLDRFKVINDSLGHTTGDKLLIEMAQRIVECTRDEDTVARLGGDEFAILLEQIRGPEDAVRVAERVLERFADPLILDDNEVSVGASIGIALSMSGEEQPENLLRDADMAMYQAKTRRSGYQIFDARMHARTLDRMKLEIDMKRAIERKQIYLHYQPIISLNTGKLAGFEALARWQHNGRGAISPAQFIPLAEETGLVGTLGSWVFREACQQMRTWRDRYQLNDDVFISVNVSSKQVSHGNLIEEIDEVLNETGLDPQHLRLEITESAIVENTRSAAQILSQLKKRRIKLCLDDFGKGFSSLNYLHRFPIDVLKIDRSFVRRLRANLIHDNGKKRPYEIVRTIVALAQILGMQVVAEGVELADQLSALKQLGCEFGQGFLFSPALEAADAARFMEPRSPLPALHAS